MRRTRRLIPFTFQFPQLSLDGVIFSD